MLDQNKKNEILLVEDDAHVQDLVRLFLNGVGYKVIVAGDGYEAMELLSDTHYAAILLDIDIPHFNGFQILGKIKGHIDLQRIPVLMLTGSHAKDDIVRAMASGANDYILKPPTKNELLPRVLRAIDRSMNAAIDLSHDDPVAAGKVSLPIRISQIGSHYIWAVGETPLCKGAKVRTIDLPLFESIGIKNAMLSLVSCKQDGETYNYIFSTGNIQENDLGALHTWVMHQNYKKAC